MDSVNNVTICFLKRRKRKRKQKEVREKWAQFTSDIFGVVKLEYLSQKMFRIEQSLHLGSACSAFNSSVAAFVILSTVFCFCTTTMCSLLLVLATKLGAETAATLWWAGGSASKVSPKEIFWFLLWCASVSTAAMKTVILLSKIVGSSTPGHLIVTKILS